MNQENKEQLLQIYKDALEDIAYCKTWTAQNEGMKLVGIALDAIRKGKNLPDHQPTQPHKGPEGDAPIDARELAGVKEGHPLLNTDYCRENPVQARNEILRQSNVINNFAFKIDELNLEARNLSDKLELAQKVDWEIVLSGLAHQESNIMKLENPDGSAVEIAPEILRAKDDLLTFVNQLKSKKIIESVQNHKPSATPLIEHKELVQEIPLSEDIEYFKDEHRKIRKLLNESKLYSGSFHLSNHVKKALEKLLPNYDLLRSAHEIALRKGADTNWEAFAAKIKQALSVPKMEMIEYKKKAQELWELGGWQDMGTAPKDGTVIWTWAEKHYVGKEIFYGEVHEYYHAKLCRMFFNPDEGWMHEDLNGNTFSDDYVPIKWQPLNEPSAPTTTDREG